MSTMASQIASLTIVYSTINSGTDQRKHQSSASLAFVWGIHRWPVNSPHKGPVPRNMFPFDNVIMKSKGNVFVLSPHPGLKLSSADFDRYLSWYTYIIRLGSDAIYTNHCYWYRYFQYKEPSYLYNGNSYTGKTYLYYKGPLMFSLNEVIVSIVTIHRITYPDSKVHGANMGPICGRQDPGGPHVGPMNLTIWVLLQQIVNITNYNTTLPFFNYGCCFPINT